MEVEAGPSVDQSIEEVPANVCGDDELPLSEYEKLRERNIRERKRTMCSLAA